MNYSDWIKARNVIRALSSTEPEQKTGKWVKKSVKGEIFDCCSWCGYVKWGLPTNYCPNCGAKMLEESERKTDE